MMEITVGILVGFSLGIVINRLLQKKSLRKKTQELEAQNRKKAEAIIQDANKKINRIKKNRQLEIKEKEAESKEKIKQYSESRKRQLLSLEQQLKQKESSFKSLKSNLKEEENRINKRQHQLDIQKKKFLKVVELTKKKEADLESSASKLKEKEQQLEQQQNQYLDKIAAVTDQNIKDIQAEFEKELKLKLNRREDKMVLRSEERIKAKTNLILRDLREHLDFESKKILVNAIQSVDEGEIYSLMTSIFHLTDDKQKGKIIGREGKNIRALEAKLNVNLIIDDTPCQVLIVNSDPYKREIAKLSLKQIIKQGLITVPYIEEVIKNVKASMETHTFEIGNNLLKELKIDNMHTNLVRLISKMAYYNNGSYNLLQYTKLVAKTSLNLASELNFKGDFIKRAAALQHIGKVYQQEQDDHYTITSSELAKAYGEEEIVCDTIANYSEEQTDDLNTTILRIANRIIKLRLMSSQDARKIGFNKVKKIEDIPLTFEGVKESFVLDSGEELYVIVDSDILSEQEAYELTDKITQKTKKYFQDTDKIKVTVVRKKGTT